jgi:hypothetical protein
MYNLVFNLFRKINLGFLILTIHPKSALITSGWFKSFRKKSVIDRNNNPIPWWTYSFIEFISERINNDLRVLEFGCGYSTIWLSNRVKEVIAFEDYPKWADSISKRINSNSKIVAVKSISVYNDYSSHITGDFDILIIDNLGNRIDCAMQNLRHLNNNGVVIWDNTDGPDWQEIKVLMGKNGFKELSFTGMVAQELNQSKTTLFYRPNNCLNI